MKQVIFIFSLCCTMATFAQVTKEYTLKNGYLIEKPVLPDIKIKYAKGAPTLSEKGINKLYGLRIPQRKSIAEKIPLNKTLITAEKVIKGRYSFLFFKFIPHKKVTRVALEENTVILVSRTSEAQPSIIAWWYIVSIVALILALIGMTLKTVHADLITLFSVIISVINFLICISLFVEVTNAHISLLCSFVTIIVGGVAYHHQVKDVYSTRGTARPFDIFHVVMIITFFFLAYNQI